MKTLARHVDLFEAKPKIATPKKALRIGVKQHNEIH